MTTRQSFEQWALSNGYSTIRVKLSIEYSHSRTREAWLVWQAATSRQEARIKALVDCLKSIKANAGKPEVVYTLAKTFIEAAEETP